MYFFLQIDGQCAGFIMNSSRSTEAVDGQSESRLQIFGFHRPPHLKTVTHVFEVSIMIEAETLWELKLTFLSTQSRIQHSNRFISTYARQVRHEAFVDICLEVSTTDRCIIGLTSMSSFTVGIFCPSCRYQMEIMWWDINIYNGNTQCEFVNLNPSYRILLTVVACVGLKIKHYYYIIVRVIIGVHHKTVASYRIWYFCSYEGSWISQGLHAYECGIWHSFSSIFWMEVYPPRCASHTHSHAWTWNYYREFINIKYDNNLPLNSHSPLWVYRYSDGSFCRQAADCSIPLLK